MVTVGEPTRHKQILARHAHRAAAAQINSAGSKAPKHSSSVKTPSISSLVRMRVMSSTNLHQWLHHGW